jgi:hypothetical protein
MGNLNATKILLLFFSIVIAVCLATYLILGACNAYYGTPNVYDILFKWVVFSPVILLIIIKIIINSVLGFIASGLAKQEKESRIIWFLFTIIFGLSGIAILYLKIILQKINGKQFDK